MKKIYANEARQLLDQGLIAKKLAKKQRDHLKRVELQREARSRELLVEFLDIALERALDGKLTLVVSEDVLACIQFHIEDLGFEFEETWSEVAFDDCKDNSSGELNSGIHVSNIAYKVSWEMPMSLCQSSGLDAEKLNYLAVRSEPLFSYLNFQLEESVRKLSSSFVLPLGASNDNVTIRPFYGEEISTPLSSDDLKAILEKLGYQVEHVKSSSYDCELNLKVSF